MPRYSVTVKRWGDYDVEADSPDEARRIAEDRARHASPDSDTYRVEVESVARAVEPEGAKKWHHKTLRYSR